MNNHEKDLELLRSTREIVSQALGLTLANDVMKKVLDGESISLDQLANEHTLTEIGNALIRLDAFPKSILESSSTSALRVCIGNWCWNIKPPDNV